MMRYCSQGGGEVFHSQKSPVLCYEETGGSPAVVLSENEQEQLAPHPVKNRPSTYMEQRGVFCTVPIIWTIKHYLVRRMDLEKKAKPCKVSISSWHHSITTGTFFSETWKRHG
jgi:hypothetical protein